MQNCFGVGVGGVFGVYELWIMKRLCPCSLRLESRSSAARYAFFFFFCLEQETMTFTLHDLPDFYVERATAHRIKRNEHSCFLSRWPNSKTKLKLHHLWEQEGPLTQLAYFAYREDRLWVQRPLICQKIKANLISHVMTPLKTRGNPVRLWKSANTFYKPTNSAEIVVCWCGTSTYRVFSALCIAWWL